MSVALRWTQDSHCGSNSMGKNHPLHRQCSIRLSRRPGLEAGQVFPRTYSSRERHAITSQLPGHKVIGEWLWLLGCSRVLRPQQLTRLRTLDSGRASLGQPLKLERDSLEAVCRREGGRSETRPRLPIRQSSSLSTRLRLGIWPVKLPTSRTLMALVDHLDPRCSHWAVMPPQTKSQEDG